jgi:hypothetical protein
VNISFDRDIAPILQSECFRCHGQERPKSHFRLDTRQAALKGGDNGVDIIPGNSSGSPLIHYVARLVPDLEMPPEGKGRPLSSAEVGLLRAWIDQGLQWGTTNPPAELAFNLSPTLRWISVEGKKEKFREIEGTKEGFGGGVEPFSLEKRVGPDTTVNTEGHVLFPDKDVQVKLVLEKTDTGFVRGGFEEWRRYYDDSGGFCQPAVVPSFALGKDLHLDIGRAWIDFGLTLPRWPRMTLGYEYQFKDGAKATLEWGNANGKNIYPASEDLHEHVHIFKFDLAHDLFDWQIQESARVEIYDLHTRHDDALSFTLGPAPDLSVHTSEGASHVQGMNTFTVERQIAEWCFITAGYLYSRFDGESSLNQTTTDMAGLPAPGNFWSSDGVSLKREAHVFSVASLVQPFEGLSLSLGAQNEWERQQAFGNISLDSGDPDLPQFFLLQPAIVQSDLDKVTTLEDAGVRFTKIPSTVLFANARLQQQDISQFEQEMPAETGGSLPESFLRDTDADNEGRDVRSGFNVSPWRCVALNAEYRDQLSDTDYNHLQRVVLAGPGYSAFIRHRKIKGHQMQTKLVLRPVRWLQTTLTFQDGRDDYWTRTDTIPDGITPGGTILGGVYDARIYGLHLVFTPFQRLHFLGSFTYTDTRTVTAQNGDPSVAPYKGNVYSITTSTTYALNKDTEFRATYSFSQANYGQNNFVDGLPLGLEYTRHGLMAGVTRRLSANVSSSLRYGFYDYSEPSSGGFNNYTAHGVFASMEVKWN